ncbi:NUDIX domain-containing protein [Virgibacillus necropolis]|uniref:NUDIX hydrolase n=1 Tax=Virgibacillus necropolis TaxID=163877 RepID=UPI00384BD397
MEPIKKAYGYVTRMIDEKPQVLVFKHSVKEAGIQIPKGTVEIGESPYDAVIREMKEETGLVDLHVDGLIERDRWENKGKIYERYFYKIIVDEIREEWDHKPTGGGSENGLTFSFFWVSYQEQVKLAPGHGDYLYRIFSNEGVKK